MDSPNSRWLLGCCWCRQLRRCFVDVSTVYSRAERVSILKYYFASKELITVCEALAMSALIRI
jgi:hypothetical protein